MRKRFKTAFWKRIELLSAFRRNLVKLWLGLLSLVSLVSIALITYEIGFDLSPEFYAKSSQFYLAALVIFFISFIVRFFSRGFREKREKSHFIAWGIFALFFFLLLIAYLKPDSYIQNKAPLLLLFKSPVFTYVFLLILSVMELSRSTFGILKKEINTSLIFVLSFLFIILVGTGLLMLPNSTTNGITFVDALFTSTSAVCVTGLVVVDTATAFTPIGQFFILLLIQIGGIGVMTLTSFFGFFLVDKLTFKNQINLGDFISEENISEIFRTLMKIIFVTLLIEAVGAIFIFISVKDSIPGVNAVYYSVFHSISAFCNAGFSTFTDNLYDVRVRYNYGLHTYIGLLIILGGIGFPILFNYLQLLKHFTRNKIRQLFGKQHRYYHLPKIINLHTKLVVYTTLILLAVGTVFFAIFEYGNTLKGLPWYGVLAESFFGSVTPRTAGFNSVNMTMILPETILLTMFLMWIGASPVSTGGGIKTTTFAVAVLNVLNVARGKERLEIGGRELTNSTLLRAFAAILLSIFIIGISSSLIKLFAPAIDMMAIVFECISALSTVGLSLGITPSLDDGSKIVLVVTMFIGRVGALTFLSGLVKHSTELDYRYPKSSIFVN